MKGFGSFAKELVAIFNVLHVQTFSNAFRSTALPQSALQPCVAAIQSHGGWRSPRLFWSSHHRTCCRTCLVSTKHKDQLKPENAGFGQYLVANWILVAAGNQISNFNQYSSSALFLLSILFGPASSAQVLWSIFSLSTFPSVPNIRVSKPQNSSKSSERLKQETRDNHRVTIWDIPYGSCNFFNHAWGACCMIHLRSTRDIWAKWSCGHARVGTEVLVLQETKWTCMFNHSTSCEHQTSATLCTQHHCSTVYPLHLTHQSLVQQEGRCRRSCPCR